MQQGKTHCIKVKYRTLLNAWSKGNHWHTVSDTFVMSRSSYPKCATEMKFRVSSKVTALCYIHPRKWNGKNIPLFFSHWFVCFSPPHCYFGKVHVPEVTKCVLRSCGVTQALLLHWLLQHDSAVCGNRQVLSGGNPARINTSPCQLLPPHYNLEIYLLPNCPSSARLHLESLPAAFF